jgi:hypothetical protein
VRDGEKGMASEFRDVEGHGVASPPARKVWGGGLRGGGTGRCHLIKLETIFYSLINCNNHDL